MGGKPFVGQIVLQTFLVMIGNIIGGILIPLVLWVKEKFISKENTKNDIVEDNIKESNVNIDIKEK